MKIDDTGERPVFNLKMVNCTLAVFAIWDTNTFEYIWLIRSPQRSQPKQIVYGVLPKSMRQDLPLDERAPKPLRPGQSIGITISYAYDYFVPSAGANDHFFKVMENGTLKPISFNSLKRPGSSY